MAYKGRWLEIKIIIKLNFMTLMLLGLGKNFGGSNLGPEKNFGLMARISENPDLRAKQYRHIRNVLACQGYLAALAAFGSCVLYDFGSTQYKTACATTLALVIPFGSAVVVEKCLTVGSKAGRIYRIGTMLYNGGMLPLKCLNIMAQSPLAIINLAMLGEIHIPAMNAKFWHIANAADDA